MPAQQNLTHDEDTNPASHAMPTLIVVSSLNPVKLHAVEQGFARMFPSSSSNFSFKPLSTPSNVADQPLSDAETLRGAINRARNARALEPHADYWIGLEGGVDLSVSVDEDQDGKEGKHSQPILSFAWIAVLSKDGRLGKARTASFYQPEEVADLVRQGIELGPADDKVFGETNSRQANGSVGLLTGDVLTRSSCYTEAVILALIPFNNPSLTFL